MTIGGKIGGGFEGGDIPANAGGLLCGDCPLVGRVAFGDGV